VGRLAAAGLLIFCASCVQIEPWPNDTVVENDGSIAPDLTGVSCFSLAEAIQKWLGEHQGCSSDGDCAAVDVPGAFSKTCPKVYNASANGPYLDALVSAWFTARCDPNEGSCVVWTKPVHCTGNVCGP
jgi:hypothetical protein